MSFTAYPPMLNNKIIHMKTSYLFLADGFEEIEAVSTIDTLRRAQVPVTVVSITGKQEVSGAHRIAVQADVLFQGTDFTEANVLILPGGMPGTEHLGKYKPLTELIERHARSGGTVAAICAAPSILGDLGLLDGKRATCYPGFESHLKKARYTGSPLEIDDNIITANGPANAILFGLAIAEKAAGKSSAEITAEAMLVTR